MDTGSCVATVTHICVYIDLYIHITISLSVRFEHVLMLSGTTASLRRKRCVSTFSIYTVIMPPAACK